MTDNKDDNNYKTLTALLEFSELDEFQFSLMEPFCRLYGPNRSKADYRYIIGNTDSAVKLIQSVHVFSKAI